MELSYDWKTFNYFFGSSKASEVPSAGNDLGPLVVLKDGNRIVSVLARGEDWSAWVGRSVKAFLEKQEKRETLVLELKQMQQWMENCGEQGHFHDQKELLKSQALVHFQSGKELNELRRKNRRQIIRSLVKKNFLLQATTQSWWTRLLPSTYGVFMRLDAKDGAREIFLIFRRKSLEVFHEADLTSLGSERIQKPSEVIRYLSEKHSIPVQGIFLQSADWAKWSQEFEPWREIALALWKGQIQLSPNRMGIQILIYLKILFRI